MGCGERQLRAITLLALIWKVWKIPTAKSEHAPVAAAWFIRAVFVVSTLRLFRRHI